MDSGAANRKSFFEGRVGVDGVDTVIRVQGIVLLQEGLYLKEMSFLEGQVGWHREG